MSPSEKEPKPSLLNLCMAEDLRSGGPSVNGMTVICGRLLDGERFEGAVDLIASHGTPQMMAALYEAGLCETRHWEAWKARLTPHDAKLVIESDEPWPHEVLEWASVVSVSDL